MSVTPLGPYTTGQGKRIAVTGKGGSGKTMLTAIMTMLIARSQSRKILTIDADSAVNLPLALGLEMNKTVSQIRRSIIEEPGTRAEIEARHIRDVMAEAVQSGPGFDLLVMGRPEGPGCYCSINDLLRYGIDSLSREYDVTLIDCEAGPEQVNRRVVNGVDFLVIVTDTSSRGMHTATSIAEVVERDREMRVGQVGLIVNKVKGGSGHVARMAQEKGFHIIGSVPEDAMVAEYDSLGRPLTGLPETCASVIAVRDILTVLTL